MTSMENEISDAREGLTRALGYTVDPKYLSLRDLVRQVTTKLESLESKESNDDLACVDHDCDDCSALKSAFFCWD